MKYMINLFAGPGAGKSTCASWLFSKLKSLHIRCEYLTEFAKDLTYEDNRVAISTQMYVTGTQLYRTKLLLSKVDIIVTDSPVLLGSLYTDSDDMKTAICSEFDELSKTTKMINVTVNRKKDYEPYGRSQSQEEAQQIDTEVYELLHNRQQISNGRDVFITIDGNEEGFVQLYNEVIKILKNEESGN